MDGGDHSRSSQVPRGLTWPVVADLFGTRYGLSPRAFARLPIITVTAMLRAIRINTPDPGATMAGRASTVATSSATASATEIRAFFGR